MKINYKNNRSMLLFFAVSFIISTIITSFSPILVGAINFNQDPITQSPANSFSPLQQAHSAAYYVTLGQCFMWAMDEKTGASSGNNPSPEIWFTKPKETPAYVDGILTDCASVAKEALTLWGWGTNYKQFLTDIGCTYDGTSKYTCSKDRETRGTNFKAAVLKKAYGNATDTAYSAIYISPAAYYAMYLETLKNKCNLVSLGTVKSIQDEATSSGDNTKYNRIINNYYEPANGSTIVYTKIPTADAKVDSKNPIIYGYTFNTDVLSSVSILKTTSNDQSGENFFTDPPQVAIYALGSETVFMNGENSINIFGHVDQGSSSPKSVDRIDNLTTRNTCSALSSGITEANAKAFLEYLISNPSTKEEPTKFTPPTTDKTTCAIPSIGWIVCPVVNFLSNIVDSSWGILQQFLEVKPSIVSQNSDTYKVWQAVRDIANVAFVIIFLVVIFSQITSFGISNYGIKKIFPRLIVAAILVNTSFIICQIAVDISNILGYSIKGVLDGFSQNLATESYIFAGKPGATGEGAAGIAGTILAGVAGVGILWASLGTLIPVLIGAVVALIMILFLLVGRQALIVLLTILSPLAFVAFLLPNTSKLFDKWKKTFTSLLLLFPIIALVVGASGLASNILNEAFETTTGVDGQIGKIAAAAVAILPLFVVPGLLKKSLDGVGNIGKTINGLGDKWGKGLGGAGKKAYDNTALARGRSIRNQAKTNFRNQKFAKSLGRKGPRSFFAKNQIPLSKASQYANQQLQRTATAESDKADSIAVTSEQALLEADILSGKRTADQAFHDSIRANDAIGAKAALNIKFQTARGRTEAHALIKAAETQTAAGTFKKDNLQSIRRHISISQPDMDSKDASIADWGHNKTYPTGHALAGQTINLTTLETMPETYRLTDTKLVGQAKNGLVEAYNAGTLDHIVAARILANTNITKDLKMPEREYLDRIVASGGGPLAPPPLGVTDTGF